jgi:DNA-binding HxlR family transcriptional regulator
MAIRKENSTYSRNEKHLIECDLTYALHTIGGRWKILILNKLDGRKLRFSELKNGFPLITERMLTLQLRALEQEGLIKRTAYAEIPPRVEYELTETALGLTPIFKQLSNWASKHRSLTTSPTPAPTYHLH